jgi:chromosome partition protein MukF
LTAPRHDPHRVLAVVAERRLSLELPTLDLGFVIALHVRAQHAQLAAFDEAQLQDIFAEVCLLLEPGADQLKKRSTYAIARLREQRMLTRVDGHGVVRTGEYALTRLATGIVEFFLEEDVLTRESLTLLTATLRTTLGEVVAAARAAVTATAAGAAPDAAAELWTRAVIGPLRVTVGELVAGIERRQRGLDLQQEEFQAEIRRLLEADWFGAIERCQGLLETTSATLRELGEILLRDTSMLLGLLHDLEELVYEAPGVDPEAAGAVQRVIEQLDRIAAWGASRQRAWSEYFQYVHRYLRDVVRLDPSRALVQRLRDQLTGATGQPFTLTVAGAIPIRLLRTAPTPRDPPPVVRPKAPREKEPAPDDGVDPQEVLDGQVTRALAAGQVTLATVTGAVNAEVPAAERYVMAGRIAQTAARLARARSDRERPWVAVDEQLVIEDWRLARVQAPGKG